MSVWKRIAPVLKYVVVNLVSVVVGVPAVKAAQYTGVYFFADRLGFDGASLIGVLPALWLLIRISTKVRASAAADKE